MKRLLSRILTLIPAICCLVSCAHDTEPKPGLSSTATRRAVLLYGGAYNSLSSNLADDMAEIKAGWLASGADADSCRWFVYRTDYDTAFPTLLELGRSADGSAEWKIVKQYSKALSTDPARMAQVITDFRTMTVTMKEHGLILWSHAAGWNAPRNGKYWFGDDTSQGFDSPLRHMGLPELATAIPVGFFSFIWADCCHMAGIEAAWQLRDRCKTYVAYPTEVLAEGMPYDRVVPHLLAPEIDFSVAAAAFFDYYNHKSGQYRSATISVTDTQSLEEVAAACKSLIHNARTPSASGLQGYHRVSTGLGPYYDLREVCRAYGAQAGVSVGTAESAIGNAVRYAAATSSFLELPINPDRYCGLSCNLWSDDGSAQNEYYKTLDWYKTVYQ